MSKIRTGKELALDFLNLKITRTPLIEELLYERDIFMLSSDAGAGKSVFAQNLIGALSFPSGKTFLGCKIVKPCKVLYIQLEGDYEETIERMRFMQDGGMIVDPGNLCIMEEKTLNVMNPESVVDFFARLEACQFIPDVIVIDPIYKLAHGDPSTGVVALAIIRFSDTLYEKYNCTNVLIHHNLKDSYGSDGKKVDKSDAFYGHSFIKNHVRTSYAMKITGDDSRILERKKGRGSDTKVRIKMNYDPEHYLLMPDEMSINKGSALDRIIAFSQKMKQMKRITNAKEICEECDVSYSRLAHLKTDERVIAVFSYKKVKATSPEIWTPI